LAAFEPKWMSEMNSVRKSRGASPAMRLSRLSCCRAYASIPATDV
jgi:hypothetical protein